MSRIIRNPVNVANVKRKIVMLTTRGGTFPPNAAEFVRWTAGTSAAAAELTSMPRNLANLDWWHPEDVAEMLNFFKDHVQRAVDEQLYSFYPLNKRGMACDLVPCMHSGLT